MKRNIERFPSKQMYPYLSLVERKVAEFYHNIYRRSWLAWVIMTYFHRFFRTIPGVLDNLQTMFSADSLSSFSTLAFSDLVEPTMTEIRTFRTLKRSEYNVLCYTMSLGTVMWSRTKALLETSKSLLILLWRRNVSCSQMKISKNIFSIFLANGIMR